MSAIITADSLRRDLDRWPIPDKRTGGRGLSQERVARALAMSRPYGGTNLVQWQLCVDHIADAIAADNPYFNRTKFGRMCGL